MLLNKLKVKKENTNFMFGDIPIMATLKLDSKFHQSKMPQNKDL